MFSFGFQVSTIVECSVALQDLDNNFYCVQQWTISGNILEYCKLYFSLKNYNFFLKNYHFNNGYLTQVPEKTQASTTPTITRKHFKHGCTFTNLELRFRKIIAINNFGLHLKIQRDYDAQ
jgi:hypothetical protein